MPITTRNGIRPRENSEASSSPGLNLGSAQNPTNPASAMNPTPNALALSTGVGPGGALSGGGALSLPQALGYLGHALTREQERIIERAEAHALAEHGQAGKLRIILHEWNNLTQQANVNTAQTFALLTALKHLSADPDYQAWWASWAKFQAERYVNTTDDLLVVGARVMAEVLAQPVQPPGELVAWWRSLFAR